LRAARGSAAESPLRLAVPEVERFLDAAFPRHRNTARLTDRLARLLALYGADLLRAAVTEALQHSTPTLSAVEYLIEKHRRDSQRQPPLPVDLIEAFANNWLELWYQPKIDPHALTARGAEALIRVRHPAWGIVPPAHFLPEEGDPHFRALSDFVVLKAIADWTQFAIDGMPIEIAINLPAAVLADPDFVRRMRRQLPDHPSFNRLIVEIDSSELIGGVPQVHGLGTAGIGVSIDNVGVEHSSLVGLEKLPVMEVKVARHVISGCAQDRLKRALCGTIIDIARRLGARTVAEGVETPADLIAAHEIGFDLVQGFLFGKPMEARKFARTLRRPLAVPK